MNLANNIQLIGELDGLPIYLTTQQGKDLTIFFLRTLRKARKAGDLRHFDRHRCVAWGELGLQLHQHLQANSRIAVRGELQYRSVKPEGSPAGLQPEIQVADFSLLGYALAAAETVKAAELYPLKAGDFPIAAE